MSTKLKARFSAFTQGFVKGLGASALIGTPRHPEPAKVEINLLHRSILSPREAMRSDWARVGTDIHDAIQKQRKAEQRKAG
jgi:hypothetical protein